MRPRYLLFQKAEAALIEEKAEKLFGLTRLLDKHLAEDFDAILRKAQPRPATKQEKIRVLNEALGPFTDMVAEAFPGVGVGYYCKDLQAIVTYGPSSQFGSKVGLDLGPGHIGWQAMELGREVVGVGSMVRGEIMNCVRPLIRGGKAIGFVWANETLADIYAQIQVGARKVFFSQDIQPILGLTGLLLFASRSLLMPPRLPARVLASREARRSRRRKQHFHTLLPYIHSINRMHRYVMLFLNSLSVGVLVANARGKIIFASDGLLRIVERQREDLLGMQCHRFLECIGLEPSSVLGTDVAAGNKFLKVPLKLPSGTREILLIAAPVGDEVSGHEGTVLLFEDLESAALEEERLQRAEKLAAVGELAAAIAHEIRNPLTIVAGSIQLIPQKLHDKEFLINSSRILGEELARVNRTVEALLNFARFSKPRWATLDINQVTERAVDVIRAYARASSVVIRERYWSQPLIIEGDPEHLQQAFLNIMLNALQAMPSGGELRVTTEQKPGSSYVQVCFEDTGVGIPEEEQEKIFDMFYSTKKGGTGLGLPLVQRIIDEHKGFIELRSKPGVGTCFTVNLPVQQLFLKLTEYQLRGEI